MKKQLLLLACAVLSVGGVSLARQGDASKSGSWSGTITNDMCGAKDASAKGADCTTMCVKNHGAKYALYTDADKKLYVLDPQDQAAAHIGHDVTVKGTVDGNTIHVSSITMNPAK